MNLGSIDPSKPLLAAIIEKLSSGIGLKATGAVTASDKVKGIEKDKEAIESSLNDVKKGAEIKDIFKEGQNAKPQLSLNQEKPANQPAAGVSAPKLGKMELPEIPPRKEAPKMMAAKKESEESLEKPTSIKTPTEKDDKTKKDQKHELDFKKPGSSTTAGLSGMMQMPEDSMKKKLEPSSRPV